MFGFGSASRPTTMRGAAAKTPLSSVRHRAAGTPSSRRTPLSQAGKATPSRSGGRGRKTQGQAGLAGSMFRGTMYDA